MILDSNIVIYAAKPEHEALRQFVAEHSPSVSAVSYVEVCGYHKLTDRERRHFHEFFEAATVLPISEAVLEEAIRLRQQRKISLGESLVAATAIVHDLTLVTRNVRDFAWIPDLDVLNPLDRT